MAPIAPQSRAFLIETFTELRDDLRDRMQISYHLTFLAKHGVVQQMEKRKGLRAIEQTPFVLAPAFMR